MSLKTYEKPKMSYVAIHGGAPVAKCWNETNNDNNKVTRYFDTPGHGFIKFNITPGQNCGNVTNINVDAVYTCIVVEAKEECEQMTPENQAAAMQNFDDAWKKTLERQANGGSNYAGIDTDYPSDPHGMS